MFFEHISTDLILFFMIYGGVALAALLASIVERDVVI